MIHQGHAYTHQGRRVLAMESASAGFVRVRETAEDLPALGMGNAYYAPVEQLRPAPMKYHGGAVQGGGR